MPKTQKKSLSEKSLFAKKKSAKKIKFSLLAHLSLKFHSLLSPSLVEL